jgi:hypothetical protein
LQPVSRRPPGPVHKRIRNIPAHLPD